MAPVTTWFIRHVLLLAWHLFLVASLLLLVRHLLLLAWHLFLVASLLLLVRHLLLLAWHLLLLGSFVMSLFQCGSCSSTFGRRVLLGTCQNPVASCVLPARFISLLSDGHVIATREAMAIRLEDIALRLEAIATRLEAIAIRGPFDIGKGGAKGL